MRSALARARIGERLEAIGKRGLRGSEERRDIAPLILHNAGPAQQIDRS